MSFYLHELTTISGHARFALSEIDGFSLFPEWKIKCLKSNTTETTTTMTKNRKIKEKMRKKTNNRNHKKKGLSVQNRIKTKEKKKQNKKKQTPQTIKSMDRLRLGFCPAGSTCVYS